MRKRGKKLLAVSLAVSMAMNLFSFQAFADENTIVETEVKDPIVNEDGTVTDTTVTTTTTTDTENGKVVVNVEIKKDTEGVVEDVAVVKEEIHTTETVQTKNGAVIDETWVKEGTETKEYFEEVEPNDEVPEVTVELKPGEPTKKTESASSTNQKDDIPENSEDKEYNFTETTTTIDRTVTATTGEIVVTEQNVSSNLEAVGPDEYDGKQDLMYDDSHLIDPDQYHVVEKEGVSHEGHDYQYVGYSEYTTKGVTGAKAIYQKDDDGNIKKDADGNPMIDYFVDFFGKVIKKDGEPIRDLETLKESYKNPDIYAFIVQFALQKGTEEDFETVFAYCCDMDVDPKDGMWYSVANLEDSDYYPTEESEDHIRGIVSNGYWGVSNEKDADGNYKTGSVAKIKENMKKAIENGEIENVVVGTKTDEQGNTVNIYLADVVDDLTEGEAMKATQSAIWSYANGSTSVQNPNEGYFVVDPTYLEGSVDAARINALYGWLMKQTVETNEVVINEKNYIDNMSLTVGNMVEDHANNNDNNNDNDIYHTDLNFKLAFVPGDNDDLLVQLTYNDLDGHPVTVVKRLAGQNSNGQNYEDIKPEADGSYVLRGLQLSENKELEFDLRLEGTQHLEQGVYIYTAGERNASQTFVGMAEGTRNVDVNASVTITFDVDENKKVTATRKWREEGSKRNPSNGNDDDDDDDNGGGGSTTTTTIHDPNVPLTAADTIEITENDVPLSDGAVLNIEDAPIPLAVLPMTGDVSVIWMLISLISGLGLAGVSFADRKKRR